MTGHQTMKPELLVLLGAGATVPAIPGVSVLTQMPLESRDFLEPNRRRATKPSGRMSDSSRKTFFQYLAEQLPNTKLPYNFEQLIGIADVLGHALAPFDEALLDWAGSPTVNYPCLASSNLLRQSTKTLILSQ